MLSCRSRRKTMMSRSSAQPVNPTSRHPNMRSLWAWVLQPIIHRNSLRQGAAAYPSQRRVTILAGRRPIRHNMPMLSSVMNATVPLASVLIGAGLTYWLGIRTRKRTFVEDLFNEAITAVAVADASQHYIRDVTQPQALSVEEYVEVRK